MYPATILEEARLGTLFSSLNLGRIGLQVAQVQLDVAGNNITNANKAGYSRQRVELTTLQPDIRSYGALGRGPAIAGISHARDVFLDTVYRQQVPSLGSAETQDTYFQRMQDIFQEPGESGFSKQFDQFFSAINDFANNVESLPNREALLSQGDALSGALRQAYGRANDLRTATNEEVRSLVPQINSLTGEIANLNNKVREIEANGTAANDARDDRDLLLDQLSKIVNISYREQDNGMVDIQLGGDVLVTGTHVRDLQAVPDSTLDPQRGDLLSVQFVDNGAKANITNGTLYGDLQMRDVELSSLESQLNTMAGSLIQNINRIHSQGNGLDNYSGPVSTTNMTLSAGTSIAVSNPPFPFGNGSFTINVYDSAGASAETITIPIVATGPVAGQTTAQQITNAVAGSAHMTAVLGSDGKITFSPQAGFTFSFSNDTAGILPALGLNGFFNGTDATNIQVNSDLHNNPRLLSSGYSSDPLETGDNTAALDMAALRTSKVLNGGTQSITDFYQSLIAQVGINTRANSQDLNVQQNFVQQFDSRRQEISGVSIDEEVTNLIQFQRAFEASARIITITDNMLNTLINTVQ